VIRRNIALKTKIVVVVRTREMIKETSTGCTIMILDLTTHGILN